MSRRKELDRLIDYMNARKISEYEVSASVFDGAIKTFTPFVQNKCRESGEIRYVGKLIRLKR